MKISKIIKRYILIVFMLVLCITPGLAGCFWGSSSFQVPTPEVTLHKESMLLSWDWVKNSKRFDVYCNDELVESISSNISKSYYFYDFSTLIDETGDYEFNVVAISNSYANDDSDKSESVTFSCTSVPQICIPESIIVPEMEEDQNKIVGVAINGTRVDVALLKNFTVDEYELYLYSQSTGLHVYPIDVEANRNSETNYSISLQLQNPIYNLQDEIYAVRIGYEKDGERKLCSNIRYVNPDGYPFYCDDIYMFDGYINDMYLESIQELRNLVYYTFVNRDTEVSVKISKPLQQVINVYAGLNGTDFKSKLLEAVVESFDYFYETRDGYDIVIHTMSVSDAQYSIQIAYDDPDYLNTLGKAEPELSYTPDYYAYDEIDWDGYYETCGLTMRSQDIKYIQNKYDNFESDKQFLNTNVETSEQLYWAVENKITPVCKAGSRAETIYNLAKQTLNNIISDEMTDYEKALSIFDWICENTSYDYYALVDGAYDNKATLVPVYYLEGVFMTGYAVCDGFSKAYSLMCNMEGIDTIRIVGTADGGGHAWNKVKLDINPNDEIDAQYYIVDITWTEMKGSTQFFAGSASGVEVSSHEYFLVNDDYIKTTHKDFENRTRYSYYKSANRYDYYDNTTFEFNGVDYNLGMNSNNTTFDLVIESEDDMVAMFYYMLVNNLEIMEVVFDYDYLVEVDKDAGGSGKNVDHMLTSLTTLMKSKKFLSQYLFLQHNYYPTIIYNSSGETGLIMVLENNLLIDAPSEVGHLVQFFSHYHVYGTYDFYIEDTILKTSNGSNDLAKAQNLFASSISQYDVNIEFTLIESSSQASDGRAYYKIVVSPKSV